MKKLLLLFFLPPFFVVAQDLPTIYTESWEEEKYIERGKLFEESYQRFLENEMNMQSYFLDMEYGESWGDECDKILDYYNRYGTITERMWIDLNCACSPFCYGGNYASAKNASSTLKSQGSSNYDVKNITDSDPRTAWVEGKSDYGIGESFEIDIDEFDMTQLSMLNGFQKSVKLWKLNSRVRTFKVYINNTPLCYLRLEDKMSRQYFDFYDLIDRNDIDDYDYQETLRFEIINIYPGEKWKDVCISDFDAGYTGQ